MGMLKKHNKLSGGLHVDLELIDGGKDPKTGEQCKGLQRLTSGACLQNRRKDVFIWMSSNTNFLDIMNPRFVLCTIKPTFSETNCNQLGCCSGRCLLSLNSALIALECWHDDQDV